MAEPVVYTIPIRSAVEPGRARRWPKLVADALIGPSVLPEVLERWQSACERLRLSAASEVLGALLFVSDLSPAGYAALVGQDPTRRAPARSHLLEVACEVLDDAEALQALVELEQRGVLRVLDATGPWFAGEVSLSPAVQAHCLAPARTNEGGARAAATAGRVERWHALSVRVTESVDEATRFASLNGEANVLILVRGQRGSGRDTVLRLLLSRFGSPAYRRTPSELRADSASLEPNLSASIPVWDARQCDPSPEDRDRAGRWLARCSGVGIIVLERDQDPPEVDRLLFAIELDAENRAEREQIWRRAMAYQGLEPETGLVQRLAHRTRAGAGLAMRAVQMTKCPLDAGHETTLAIDQALFTLGRPSSTRGVFVEKPEIAWSRLVVSETTGANLDQLFLLARLGEVRDVGRKGLRALFSGPPGTGKTLAARAIASELDLALHRVDLAAIVSKWVGETEKNLRQVLAAAEATGAVLFFDEGDALLAKRGDVTRGSDRYANHEVSYLLQALENHDGIVLVATNLKQNLDQAFFRRFEVSVDFTLPTAQDRRRLWRQELGEQVTRELGPGVLEELAGPELAGGNIANAARLAQAIAHGRGSASIRAGDARRAIAAEFYKLGSTVQGSQWMARVQRADLEASPSQASG